MTWVLNASGNVPSREDEQRLIDTLRPLVREHNAHLATLSTTNHGQVDLLAEVREAEEPSA